MLHTGSMYIYILAGEVTIYNHYGKWGADEWAATHTHVRPIVIAQTVWFI